MRILYVADSPPWQPKFGGAMRNYNVVKGLARNHEVMFALATLSGSSARYFLQANPGFARLHVLGPAGGGAAGDADLRDSAYGKLKATLGGSDARFSREFAELVAGFAPDVVYYYGKPALRRCGFAGSVPAVVDMFDVESLKLSRGASMARGSRRLKARLGALAARWEERRLVNSATVLIVSNPDERRLLGNGANIRALPNGYDFPEQIEVRPRTSKRVLFLGSLFYHPNLDGLLWFCDEVWPRVKAEVGDASLDVVGHCERQLDRLGELPDVTIHGFVEDTSGFFEQSAFLVVPLRIAAGTRLKILEAWAKGLPVVSTGIGAEGLAAADGETAAIANSAADFARACVDLMQCPEKGAGLAAAAFEHGRARFDWQRIYPALDEIVAAACAGKP